MKSYTLITTCLILLLYVYVPITLVHAQTVYTVSPLVIDEEVQARDILTRKIILTNTGTQPTTIFPTVNNISLQEGGTIDEFLTPSESDKSRSLASWLEISRAGIDLQPGNKKEITLTIHVSPNPEPGTYHAFVGFGYGTTRNDAEAQVKDGSAPGTIVSVVVKEKKVELIKLSKFVVDRFVTKPENQAASYTFRNPGTSAVTPVGEIILFDSTGKEVGSVKVNNENLAIQPGEEHVFVAQLPIDGMIGKYKAFLSVEYGNEQKATVQDTNFYYVLPLKLIIAIIGTLLLLVGVSAWYIHRKYFDDADDDRGSDVLELHIRDTVSEPKEHDVNLKKDS